MYQTNILQNDLHRTATMWLVLWGIQTDLKGIFVPFRVWKKMREIDSSGCRSIRPKPLHWELTQWKRMLLCPFILKGRTRCTQGGKSQSCSFYMIQSMRTIIVMIRNVDTARCCRRTAEHTTERTAEDINNVWQRMLIVSTDEVISSLR